MLLSFQSKTHAQNFGFEIGYVMNFGSHVNAVGFSTNVYYSDYFYQVNLSNQLKMNISSYGKRKIFIENRLATGLILLAGKRENTKDFQFDALIHNTEYNYALGYNYIIYSDDAGTSQKSGGWSIALKQFSILFENDVFGGQARDRFRSGNLELSYRTTYQKYFTNFYIWTGETKSSTWKKTAMENAPNGFRSLENLPYGKTSHGIFSAGVRGILPLFESSGFGSLYSVKVGVDSEQIRHFFQNKMSHDLILMPKKYKRNTPHYPRLNQEGLPIFKKEERRKDRLFLQFSVNEIWSN